MAAQEERDKYKNAPDPGAWITSENRREPLLILPHRFLMQDAVQAYCVSAQSFHGKAYLYSRRILAVLL